MCPVHAPVFASLYRYAKFNVAVKITSMATNLVVLINDNAITMKRSAKWRVGGSGNDFGLQEWGRIKCLT